MTLDDRVRDALRREEPSVGFAERIFSRVRAVTKLRLKPPSDEASRSPDGEASLLVTTDFARAREGRPSWRRPAVSWLVAGVAASVLIAIGVGRSYLRQRTGEQGEEAKAQAVLALRIASEKLNVAQQMVRRHGTERQEGSPEPR